MMARRKKTFIKVGFVISLAVVFYFIIFDPFYVRAISDRELIALFKKNKKDFVVLSEVKPAYQRVLEERITQADHPNSEKEKLIENAFHNIGSPKIIYDKGSSKFIYSLAPLFWVGPEWQKGIIRQDKCIDTVLPSLDNPTRMSEGAIYCRKIDDGWWVIFENFN